MKHKYIALDTETYKGKAFLLSCPKCVFQVGTFADFVESLYELGATHFTFFNLNYDVSALLKHLPQNIVEKIYLDKTVQFGVFTFRYIAGKYFYLHTPRCNFHFYDLYPFFQCSLNDASLKYLGKRKVEMPKSLVKNLSPRNYQKHRPLVDRYAIGDASLLQGLTDLILNALDEVGLSIEHLYSPGYVAKRFLKDAGFKISDVPFEFREFAAKAYHGARMEVVKRGYFPKVNIYDIKSAYPAAFAELPDLLNATYSFDKKIKTQHYIVQVKIWDKPAHSHLLPEIRDKLLIFPQHIGQSVVMTCFEYEYLRKHKLAEMRVEKVLNIVCRNEKPFRKIIRKLYKERAKSPARKIIFKLILNSLYGIFLERRDYYEMASFVRGYYQCLRQYENNLRRLFVTGMAKMCPYAQSFWLKKCDCKTCRFTRRIMRQRHLKDKSLFQHDKNFYEKRKKKGRFYNIVMAAFVTAKVRIKIFDLQRQCGNKFIACFTDSILTLPKKFSIGENLGDLEKKYTGRAWVFGTGLYQTDEETKTRGFRWNKKLTSILRKYPKKRIIKIPQKIRVSLGIMIRRPLVQFDDFNLIEDRKKNLDLNFDEKRVWDRKFRNAKDALENRIESKAILLDNDAEIP